MLEDTEIKFQVLEWDYNAQKWRILRETEDSEFARRVYDEIIIRDSRAKMRLRKVVTKTAILADHVPGQIDT